MNDSRQWSRLDNAAKIFPPTSTGRDPRVFRFACELYEPVDPDILQTALDKTLEQFPHYLSVIKRGFFWHYLEATELRPVVEQETRHPCSRLYGGNRKRLLFSVTYYRNRINLEVFHVLSDGSGAIQFFRAMVLHYLTRRHRDELEGSVPTLDYDAAQSERDRDSFSKYYSNRSALQRVSVSRSYQLRGDRQPVGQMLVLEGRLSSGEVRAAAKRRGSTITEFLTAVLIVAIGEGMDLRRRKLPVNIAVPVDLRQYFPSSSARNFFAVMYVGCKLGERIDFDAVLEQVQKQFKEELTEENIRDRMNRLAALEHNPVVKAVPLVIKDPVLNIANWMVERQVTAGLSNVGRITLPDEVAKYVHMIDVFNSTGKVQVLLSSFGDQFIVNFTSTFSSTDIQRRFFRYLTDLGLSCEISTNWRDREEAANVL